MQKNKGFYRSDKLSLPLVAFVLLAMTLGCNFSCGKFAETTVESGPEQANKLIREGNASTEKANEAMNKAEALSNELLGSDTLKEVQDVEKYKADNKTKFDDLSKLREEAARGFEEAAAKYEQISTLNVAEKYKEYTGLLAQQSKKLVEIIKADAAFDKAFLAEKDTEKHGAMFVEYNKKNSQMRKELNELKEKATKLMNDNPDVFKKQ